MQYYMMTMAKTCRVYLRITMNYLKRSRAQNKLSLSGCKPCQPNLWRIFCTPLPYGTARPTHFGTASLPLSRAPRAMSWSCRGAPYALLAWRHADVGWQRGGTVGEEGAAGTVGGHGARFTAHFHSRAHGRAPRSGGVAATAVILSCPTHTGRRAVTPGRKDNRHPSLPPRLPLHTIKHVVGNKHDRPTRPLHHACHSDSLS